MMNAKSSELHSERPAFYALRAGGWRDYVTLLHPPYTLWHLSYVVLGAAAAPEVALTRLGWTLAAFFLAVGVGAHALDELHGRPLKTKIPSALLLILAGASLAGALAIGVAGAFVISQWLWAFVAFGAFIVVAYNLELLGSRFHNDFWFAASWGAFPFITAYWATAEQLDVGAGLLAGGCFALSLGQRSLSNRVRKHRRHVASVSGTIHYRDGTSSPVRAEDFIKTPEAALKILAVFSVILAGGWLAVRV